jgi:alkylation response protein AidB-like acyl-CoA dehydrogenase
MEFTFTGVQSEFRATLRRFLNERGAQAAQAGAREMARRWRAEHWAELAELGALAALLPEDCDGLGGDSVDAIAMLEEIGRAQAGAPLIETAIVAAGLIDRLGSPAQKREFLPAIAAGRLKCSVAEGGILAPGGTGSSFEVRALDNGEYRVEGRQALVAEAPDCDWLLVVCGRSLSALSVFCVKPDQAGVRLQPFWTIDDRPAASLSLEAVALEAALCLGGVGEAGAALADVFDCAAVAQCAEAVGLMASLLNQTIAHLKTRTQFGQPLAEFQALQHRLVDMYAAYELSLSLTYKAAILSKQAATDDQRAAVSGAKVQAAEAARLIGHEAIQMHGAMGMSLEVPVGRAVKRLKAMDPQYGSPSYHLRRYRALRRSHVA